MIEFINKHFKTLLIIFSILSLTSVTRFWWISFFSMIFFIWNIFNSKRKLDLCIAFLSLTVLLNIFYFTVLMPDKEWSKKVHDEWAKTGYDPIWLANSQESINIIDRVVEEYKLKYGTYPDSLNNIKEVHINNQDNSYRIRGTDGQTNGIPFYYEKIDSNKFRLAGVGKDGIIKTNDDLLPQISKEQEKTTGLVKYASKSFSSKEIERERKVIEMFRKVKILEKTYNKE